MIFGKKVDKVTQEGLNHLDELQKDMSNLNVDQINTAAPAVEIQDPQVKWSKTQVENYDAPVIKPVKSFAPRSRPDPKEAKERARGWELVKVIVENKEVIGEAPQFWLDRFKGDPTYYWEVPTNIPIYLPRFVAEHLSKRVYHKFKMRDQTDMNSADRASMTVQETYNRIDCRPAGFGL